MKEEQQQVWDLIKTGDDTNIEIAIELAFSLEIDIKQQQLLKLHHDLFPLDIYKKDKAKLVKLLGLQTLEIENQLPVYIQYLPNLHSIRLQGHFHNDLKTLWSCSSLKKIELNGVHAVEFGFQLHRLSALEQLSFLACQIRSIHKDMRKASQLKTLIFHSNRQLYFPKLDAFINLKSLLLANNQFPKRRIQEIMALEQLETLIIHEEAYKKTELERLKKVLPNCKINP